mgnify:CR=1 FL=1
MLHMNASDKEINMAAGCNGIKNDANTRYPASMIASNVCTELVANGVGSLDKWWSLWVCLKSFFECIALWMK